MSHNVLLYDRLYIIVQWIVFIWQLAIITSGLLLSAKHLIVCFLTGTIMTSKTYLGCPCPPTISFVQRLGSALFYGACSCLITIVNKLVLTSYGYVFFFVFRDCFFSYKFHTPIIKQISLISTSCHWTGRWQSWIKDFL